MQFSLFLCYFQLQDFHKMNLVLDGEGWQSLVNMAQYTIGFHKMRYIYWSSEKLFASQEEVSSTEAFLVPSCLSLRGTKGHTMYVYRNNEGCSCNHCCRGKAIILHILSVWLLPRLSSMQSACAVLHSCLWPAWFYQVFLRCLINGMIFEKTFLNIKYGFGFSTSFAWNNSHYKKNSARYYHKCTQIYI